MFNSTASYHVTGAAINFRLRGTPDEVTRDVHTLFNYGVISKFPVDFKAGESSNVTVQSDRGRMERGFNAFADVALRTTLRGVALRSRGKSYLKMGIQAEALAMFMEIPRERLQTERVQKHVPVLAACEVDEDEKISDADRKRGKAIIAYWFGRSGRDSANGRNAGFED